MGVTVALGLDVPNFTNDVPNFIKKCTKGSKVRPERGNDLQSLRDGFLNQLMEHG